MAELPDFLTPKLRLFLSVDIVNSTAFKQAARQTSPKTESKLSDTLPAEPWFSPISTFYRNIEKNFAKEWANLSEIMLARRNAKASTTQQSNPPTQENPLGPAPQLWKSAGDEVFYVKILTDHQQALFCVAAWMNAVNHHRKSLKAKYPILDLKAAAWLAGFPVNNAEILLRSNIESPPEDIYGEDPLWINLNLLSARFNGDGNGFIDYIGPSVDTGFRVATVATPRKFVITVDLALMLSHAAVNQPNEPDYPIPKLKFHYDGRIFLKGVHDGTPYPLFWIDMAADDSLNEIEDKMLNNTAIGSSEVKEFCEIFMRSSGKSYMIKPFIHGAAEEMFAEIPEYHRKRLEHLANYWRNESEKREIEEKSATEPGRPDTDNQETNADLKIMLEKLARLYEEI